jgi:hypothetical protein
MGGKKGVRETRKGRKGGLERSYKKGKEGKEGGREAGRNRKNTTLLKFEYLSHCYLFKTNITRLFHSPFSSKTSARTGF